MVDVAADKYGLTISATGAIRLRIHAKDLIQNKITATVWELPGLYVSVDSNAKSFRTENSTGETIDLIYNNMTNMNLTIRTSH